VYRALADGEVRKLIEAAAAAPSIHNTQPWRFRVTGDVIELHGDPDRMLWVADPRGRALHLSCGAALFNLRLAIRMQGAKPLVWPLPDPQNEPTLLASVQLEPSRPAASAERELFEVIGRRHSSRAPFSARPVPGPVQVELEQAAGAEFALLRTLNDRDAAAVLELAAAAGRALEADFDHRVELSRWIAGGGDDGIPAAALAHRPDAAPASGPPPVRDFGYAAPCVERPAGHYEPQPRLAVLSTARDEPGDWLRAGQALQRVLLTAACHGLATSLLYQPIEQHDAEHQAGGWWPWPECPQVIVRFGYGPPGPGTPRRRVEDILDA